MKWVGVLEPVSFEEKCRLWRDSINHSKISDGTIDWVVFEQGYYGNSLLGELSYSSVSDEHEISDNDCVFFYSSPGLLCRRGIFYSMYSSKSEGEVFV